MFYRRVERSRGRPALRHKVGGQWLTLSWADWGRAAREIAGGLVDLGIAPGDRVAILAQTRVEWALCDAGALLAGAVVVPIYPSSLPDQVEHIVRDSGATLIIAEDPHQLDKLFGMHSDLTHIEKVVLLSDRAALDRPDREGRITLTLADVVPDSSPVRDWVLSLDQLRERGRALLEGAPLRLTAIADDLDPQQAATIIYTSGTTGMPKGVVLSHANLVFECSAVEDLLDLGEADEQLMFLPLAHSLARSILWAGVAIGFTTSVAESIAALPANLAEVRPTILVAVPRVLEKAHARVQADLEAARKQPVARRAVDWALARGRERAAGSLLGPRGHTDRVAAGGKLWNSGRRRLARITDRLADKLLFEKIRDAFGGRVRFLISGGAPLAPDIAEFFHVAGITVLEGYGLTETCGAATCTRPDAVRFGAVGQPLPGVELRIAADGEILIRGGNVMQGYFNCPEATAEALDAEGWFHTGDIGDIDEQGRLAITDRKKDIIVTAGGKNVGPQNIENELKARCPLLSQVVVIGDRRKYLVALLTLSADSARALAAAGRLPGAADLVGDMDRFSRHPDVVNLVTRGMDELNRTLASHETIKRFAILPADFTQESGELTPSLKVKRKVVVDRYRDQIERLYREEAPKRPVQADSAARP
jgi:long-chain acyl-CoA synthetase